MPLLDRKNRLYATRDYGLDKQKEESNFNFRSIVHDGYEMVKGGNECYVFTDEQCKAVMSKLKQKGISSKVFDCDGIYMIRRD